MIVLIDGNSYHCRCNHKNIALYQPPTTKTISFFSGQTTKGICEMIILMAVIFFLFVIIFFTEVDFLAIIRKRTNLAQSALLIHLIQPANNLIEYLRHDIYYSLQRLENTNTQLKSISLLLANKFSVTEISPFFKNSIIIFNILIQFCIILKSPNNILYF